MIKVENIDVWGFEHAIRGMRNAMQSHSKSDSNFELECDSRWCPYSNYYKDCIGANDLDLMRRLYMAGDPSHRKFMRQIMVSMDITAPMYFFSEYDTYKIGTVANSTSKMHTLHKTKITSDLFSIDDGIPLAEYEYEVVDRYFHVLEDLRSNCKSGDKMWRALIQLLPESFNQTRTVTMNYENVVTIIKQRSGHKLSEWREFIKVLKDLPYIREITEWDETKQQKHD